MLKVTLVMCGSGGQKMPLSSSGWCSVQLNWNEEKKKYSNITNQEWQDKFGVYNIGPPMFHLLSANLQQGHKKH